MSVSMVPVKAHLHVVSSNNRSQEKSTLVQVVAILVPIFHV